MATHKTTSRIVAFILITTVLLPTSLKAATAGDKGSVESFIDSIAEMTYAAAWPSATFKGVSIKGTELVSDGYDVAVRLTGESAFGGDLWLDLVFEIRNGGLHDMRIGGHNAILVPPFETTKALGAFIEEMIDDYNGQTRQHVTTKRLPATTGRVGAVCIMNSTDYTLSYSYRWGEEGVWNSESIDAHYNSWYWWRYDSERQISPKFYIRFDDNLASGVTERAYWLKRNSTSLPVTCEKAKQYRFTTNGQRIDIEPLF
jgi:hypothetical protein